MDSFGAHLAYHITRILAVISAFANSFKNTSRFRFPTFVQDVKPLKNKSLSYSSHLCPLFCLWLCPLSRAVLSLSPWKRGCLSSVLKSRSRRKALDPFSLPSAVVRLGIHTIVLQSNLLRGRGAWHHHPEPPIA